MMELLLRALHEPDGSKISTSRCLLMASSLLVFAIWLAIGVLIVTGQGTWQEYAGWMGWVSQAYLGSAAPYAFNRVGRALEGMTGSRNSAPAPRPPQGGKDYQDPY